MFETIVALATPPMKSALAIIRMSGDNCFQIVNKMFNKDISKTTKRDIYYGNIVDGKKVIDEVVLLAYKNPHSFTGEDSVEIISHGSMLIARQIIDLSLSLGARMATNGEFSSRAFLNHKIDLVQAEAINDLINATTNEAKDLSLLSLEGKTSDIFKPIKAKLGELLAKIEVNIDYPEYEDIEEVSREEIVKSSSEIISSLKSLIESGEKDKLYHDGVKVAIVGKPNVGKSSLLNVLLNEDKAIVTDIAGTTRDIVEGEISIEGVPVRLYDTAGYHLTDDVIENIGISKVNNIIKTADLIIYVKDDSGIDENLYNAIKSLNHIVVTNKADLLFKKDDNTIYISAKDHDVSKLIDAIKERFHISTANIAPSFYNVRQLALLKQISKNLETAIKDTKNNLPIDLVSVSLISAYNAALDLLGETNKNDLTEEIFSRFCVGK